MRETCLAHFSLRLLEISVVEREANGYDSVFPFQGKLSRFHPLMRQLHILLDALSESKGQKALQETREAAEGLILQSTLLSLSPLSLVTYGTLPGPFPRPHCAIPPSEPKFRINFLGLN